MEPARIDYVNRLEDVVALTAWVQAHNPEVRRTHARTRVGLALLVFAAVFAVEHVLGMTLVGLVGGAVGALIFYIWLFPLAQRKTVARAVADLYARDTTQVLCAHTLEVTPEALVERTAAGGQTTHWDAVGRVVETPEHLFVFLGQAQAHIVPRARVAAEAYARFKEAVQAMKAEHHAQQLAALA